MVPGSCFCGAVRFEVEPPVHSAAYCHCSMCRRMHGAGYVAWLTVPYPQLRIVAGEDRLTRFCSSEHGTRRFCGTCGSPLFCESTTHADSVAIPLAAMQGAVDALPVAHFYFDDRAPWTHVDDGLPRFGGKSGMEPR
jgi:hypothetical protein